MKNRSNKGPYRRLRRLNSGLKSAFSLGQCFSSFSKFFLKHQHCPANLIFLSLLLSLCFLFVFFFVSLLLSLAFPLFSRCVLVFGCFFGLFFILLISTSLGILNHNSRVSYLFESSHLASEYHRAYRFVYQSVNRPPQTLRAHWLSSRLGSNPLA